MSVSVPIADVSRVTIGSPARLTGLAPGPVLRVVSRPVAVEPGTAAVPVRLSITGRTTLPAGAPVEVEIDAEEHKDVVIVPTVAIVREGADTAVFVVDGDKAQRRTVTLGASDDQRTEVRSGLKAGEMVIVDGQAGLPDGAAITTTTDQDTETNAGGDTASPQTP